MHYISYTVFDTPRVIRYSNGNYLCQFYCQAILSNGKRNLKIYLGSYIFPNLKRYLCFNRPWNYTKCGQIFYQNTTLHCIFLYLSHFLCNLVFDIQDTYDSPFLVICIPPGRQLSLQSDHDFQEFQNDSIKN